MRRMHYYGAASPTVYWVGPGGWVYAVTGTSIVVVWSPTSKREINTTLTTIAASKVRDELAASGKSYATKEAAFAAVGATVGGGSAGLSTYLPSFPTTSGMPGTGGSPGFDLSAMDPTKQPWFWPAVIGVSGVLVLLSLQQSPRKKKPVPAKPASAFRAAFG